MIEQFRQVWAPCEGQSSGVEAFPGRGSAAKVARWALERTADILACWGRTQLRIAAPASTQLTPHERSLHLVVKALAQGDAESARNHASWLVRPAGIAPLLRALQPVACGPAARTAATAVPR
jgi:hypothetical protein